MVPVENPATLETAARIFDGFDRDHNDMQQLRTLQQIQ